MPFIIFDEGFDFVITMSLTMSLYIFKACLLPIIYQLSHEIIVMPVERKKPDDFHSPF